MCRTIDAVILTAVILSIQVNCLIDDGKYFIVACPSLGPNSPSVDCMLHILGAQGTTLTISGTMPGLPKTETLSVAALSKISIRGDYSTAQILIITTSLPVSIFVENQASSGTSVYLAAPLVQNLAQPYIGASTEDFLFSIPVSTEENVYIIGAAYAGTSVMLNIKSPGQFTYDNSVYNDGSILNVVLEMGEAIQIVTLLDLSGTLITSSHPIGVFVGTKFKPTLEQIPPPADWFSRVVLGWLDSCTSLKTRILSSVDGGKVDAVTVLNKGQFMDYFSNETYMLGDNGPEKMLYGVRCELGSNKQPFTMFWHLKFKSTFKCLALAGYENTAYIINPGPSDPTLYDVNGQDVLFNLIDTVIESGVSLFKSNVSEGYLQVKSKDTNPFQIYMTGIKTSGAYGYPCAAGSLATPDPLNSLVLIPLAVYSTSLTSESTTSTIAATSTLIVSDSSTAMVSTSTASITVSTTPATIPTTSLLEQCFCKCGENEILANETEAFLEKYDTEIKKNLTMDVKVLSSYIRTKTSAEDPRPSARNVGYLGITLITVTFGFLVLADLLSVFKIAKPKVKSS